MPEEALADGRLLASLEGHVATLTFNNPEKHNALSTAMWVGMHDILRRWSDDAAVRVLVLTGAGERAFISGADIGSFDGQQGDEGAASTGAASTGPTSTGADRAALERSWRSAVWNFPKPVIASIRGWCLGGGVAVATQADIRIAARSARFGIPAGRLGLAYDADMIDHLLSVVGAAQARLLLFGAERIDADRAARIGLVHEVVEDAELGAKVADLAAKIAANAPLSLQAMKRAIADRVAGAAERDTRVELAIDACLASQDFAEGRAAFRERRDPVFRGS